MLGPMADIPQRLSTAPAGRYRFERELGAGGMATVYLAHDLKHDGKVAVKVTRSTSARSRARADDGRSRTAGERNPRGAATESSCSTGARRP